MELVTSSASSGVVERLSVERMKIWKSNARRLESACELRASPQDYQRLSQGDSVSISKQHSGFSTPFPEKRPLLQNSL